MKRVLVIATTPFYSEKGSSLRIHSIVRMLAKEYEVDLVTYSLGQDVAIPNLEIFRTPAFFQPAIRVSKVSVGKIILDFFVLWKSFLLLLRRDYNTIHCEDFEAALIGTVLNKIFRKRLVYDLHNRIVDNWSISGRRVPSIVSLLERWVIRNTDLFIANWKIYESDPIFSNSRIFLQYDTVGMSTQEIELPAEKYIFYAGNFEEYQGVLPLIEAYSKSSCSHALLLAGVPSREVVDFVSSNKLENRVVLLGIRSVLETNYLIQHSTCCMLPRITGKQPSMKLIHYFLWGKPVIATDISCNWELLEDGKNGYKYTTQSDLIDLLSRLDNNDFLPVLAGGIVETTTKIQLSTSQDRFLNEYSRG